MILQELFDIEWQVCGGAARAVAVSNADGLGSFCPAPRSISTLCGVNRQRSGRRPGSHLTPLLLPSAAGGGRSCEAA
ncbi:MAG: hypothetical protein C0183_21465 [Roseiflexus castenholzii]|nr:MAG: hypothetical protein C0183_21465 [Roseiflexus castenholzii]